MAGGTRALLAAPTSYPPAFYLPGPFESLSPPESFPLIVPHIDPEKGVSYHRRVLRFGPGAYLPIISVDQKSAEVTMRWPPEGSPSPVSPEAESVARYPLTQTESDPRIVMT